MAVLQKENGVAVGRGFAGVNPDGLLAKFKAWVVKAPASGGPGWYILKDDSAEVTDPGIVISDTAAPGHNDYNTGPTGGAPKIIRVWLSSTNAGYILFDSYLGFDGVDASGFLNRSWIGTYDAGSFAYMFKGGDEFMSITTNDGTSLYGFSALCNWTADLNVEDPATNVTTMTNGFSGVTTKEATIVVGDTSFFEVDKYYYITDSRGSARIDYVKCTNVDGGASSVTITRQSNNDTNWSDSDYQAGAVIGSYPHRYTLIGREHKATTVSDYTHCAIPYAAYIGSDSGHKYATASASNYYGNPWSNFATNDLLNDYSDLAQQVYLGRELRGGNVFNSSISYLYRDAHGVVNDTYMSSSSNMTVLTNGKVISGKNYLYHISGENGKAILLLDDTSLV